MPDVISHYTLHKHHFPQRCQKQGTFRIKNAASTTQNAKKGSLVFYKYIISEESQAFKIEMTVLIYSRITSRNSPLFQPSDQVSGFKFLVNTPYYSLYIFPTCIPPGIFNYNNRESEVEYAHFHLDSRQCYQLGPS